MRLFLLSFLVLANVSSCLNSNPQSEDDFVINHFTHSGHDYIYFKSPSYGSTILHDPDCQIKDSKK